MIILGALIIGITLGLLGSGGSAITVPILVYLVGHAAKQSIAESMAIVGLISLAAAIPYAQSRQVDWRSVALFGVPGMLGTFAGAWLGGKSLPALQLFVFGVVLVLAAGFMLKVKSKSTEKKPTSSHKPPSGLQIGIEGMLVGTLTGFVGVGGGFLIVPALVAFGKLPIRLAMGTSLVIIALSSSIGFLKYQHQLLQAGNSIDTATVTVFVVLGAVGSIVGKQLNARLNQNALKKGFAVFLLIIGALVIAQEGSKLFSSNGSDQALVPEAASQTYATNSRSLRKE